MAGVQPQSPVLVVGAGITGLSAAWLLTQAGISVEIKDAAPEPGGLLAPVDFRGLPCDRGSHRIHPTAHPLLGELTRDAGWLKRPRRGQLVLDRTHMRYPLQIGDFLRGLGPKTALHMGANFMVRPGARRGFRAWEEDRQDTSDDIGFEAFVTQRVGRRAYKQFYAPYVEKVWGLHPAEISQTVAKARISTASPLSTLKKALRPSESKDAHFLYPSGGMTALVDYLLTRLDVAGIKIQYDTQVTADDLKDWPGAVLFSGHLSALAPDHGLSHRGLYLMHVAVPSGTIGPTDTFYLPEADYWFGRVSQPARFSEEMQDPDVDILCIEIPEGRWGPDMDFCRERDTIEAQLQHAGILPPGQGIQDIQQTFEPRVYPMYTLGWLDRWRAALDEVSSLGSIFPIGRQGLYLHCNIDHCVHIADECVRHITGGGTPQAWAQHVSRFLDLRVRD